ncbi:MAG: metallophosphoesterase [Melioribacteraceae bacterium]|nr:MAG: metallophosphoesterase [Melioribacteraceae bacterium]
MKIAHLSDLHFCSAFKRTNIGKTKRVLKYAVERGFDHLVITGDVSDNSEVKDYITLRRLLESFNLLDPAKTSIVIGNHDIFGGAQRAIDVVNFPAKCIQTDYNAKVKEFTDYFRELFDGVYRPAVDKIFPYAKQVGDTVLIGLNSIDVYSRLKNPFASNGRVSNEQFDNLMKIFNLEEYKGLKKCVMIHHHFYKNNIEATASKSLLWNKIESFTLKLRGKKKLLRAFSENDVVAVFHGHSHEIKEYYRKKIKFFNAGATIDNGDETKASIFLTEITPDGVTSELKSISSQLIKIPEGNPILFNSKHAYAEVS